MYVAMSWIRQDSFAKNSSFGRGGNSGGGMFTALKEIRNVFRNF
jgi:hypothetical protein